MKIAIVTGASSGLGEQFVKAIGRDRPEIDEIWVIARRSERLEKLADTYRNKKIVPLVLDLTKKESVLALTEKLAAENPSVGILINNAGSGVLGNFAEVPPEKGLTMAELNVWGLTAVTSAVLPYMGKGSFIVNVSSIAAFCPNPRLTVYSATKAYVYHFSAGLRYELKGRGIHVLAVCPGPMDTEFLPVAGITKGASATFDRLPRCDPGKVARTAVARAAKGKGTYTPRFFYRFYHLLSRLVPYSIMMHAGKA